MPPDAAPPARPPWWLWPNLLALDAPLVAVVWQRSLGAAFDLPLPWAATVVLALVVWGCYLLDRRWDARRPVPLPAERHAFARRHHSLLGWLGGLALAAGLTLALVALPCEILSTGAVLALLVAGYFALIHLTARGGELPAKELTVGVFFAAGVAVPLAAADAPGWLVWLPAVVGFAALCWWNCRLIDGWESRGPGLLRSGAAASLLVIVAAFPSPIPIAAALLASLTLLWLLHFLRNRLSLALRRVLVDAALLTPLLTGWRS